MSERVATRHVGAADEIPLLIDEALSQLQKYRAWLSGFAGILDHAQRGSQELGRDYVWQDDFVDFWAPFTSIQQELLSLNETLSDASAELGAEAESLMDPPADAQIEFVTEQTEFFPREGHARRQIAYSTKRLETWHNKFSHWIDEAVRGLRMLRRRV